MLGSKHQEKKQENVHFCYDKKEKGALGGEAKIYTTRLTIVLRIYYTN